MAKATAPQMPEAERKLRCWLLSASGDDEDVHVRGFVAGHDERRARVENGEPLLPVLPASATLTLEKGARPLDILACEVPMLVVSRRFRDLIAAHCPEGIEIVPVKLVTADGRTVSEEHAILNPLGSHDCLDPEMSVIRPGRIHRAVLDRAKVAATPQLFRVAEERAMYVVRRDLARAARDHPERVDAGPA